MNQRQILTHTNLFNAFSFTYSPMQTGGEKERNRQKSQVKPKTFRARYWRKFIKYIYSRLIRPQKRLFHTLLKAYIIDKMNENQNK